MENLNNIREETTPNSLAPQKRIISRATKGWLILMFFSGIIMIFPFVLAVLFGTGGLFWGLSIISEKGVEVGFLIFIISMIGLITTAVMEIYKLYKSFKK